MGGYSKMKDNTSSTTTSKSGTDFSSDPNKAADQATKQEPMKEQVEGEEKEGTLKKKIPPLAMEEGEEEEGKGKLKRNYSTASRRFMRLDRQNSSSINVSSKALQGALRRAFSVRSSSDKYSRIYSDGPVSLASPFEQDHDDYDEDGTTKPRSGGNGNKCKSRILRACKRIFGL